MKSLNRADAEYYRLLLEIMGQGIDKNDRTGTGTKSVFGRQIRFNMKDGFPLLTTKKIHIRSVIHELLWFLSGNTNTEYLNENGVTIWDEWVDEDGNLGPVYGKQWVDWECSPMTPDEVDFPRTVNQIQNLIEQLKTNPDSRRLMVNAYNVGELDQMALPPCHYGFQVYTRELSLEEKEWQLEKTNCINDIENDRIIYGHKWENYIQEQYESIQSTQGIKIPTRAISLMWNQRSVDVGLGLPFNIASYAFLLHMFAQQVDMVPSELIGNLGDTHIYSNHVEQLKEQMTRSSKSDMPTLKLNKAKDIFSYTYEDFDVQNYDAHPNIKMPIAV
jgi:thymidylate synthase